MNLYNQVYQLTHAYVRKGGSRSRKDRRKIMLKFAKFAQSKGVNSLGQLGKRHVILYWKANADLKESTLKNHWYALADLWELAGITGALPKYKMPHELRPIVDEKHRPLATEELIDAIIYDSCESEDVVVLTELRR